MYINEINLMDELIAINQENTLKKRLEENISLSYMSNFNESRKIERIKFFQEIQVLIKREDFGKLSEFCKENVCIDEVHKNFDNILEYKKPLNKINRGQLENSKDRLLFLNQLITNKTDEYDPIKNFIQKYRMKNKLVQDRLSRQRQQRLNFLKSKDARKAKSILALRANKIIENNILKKKLDDNKMIIKEEIIVKKVKSSQVERMENISLKDGNINENTEFISSGMYELAEYNKAIIFKFTLNFNKSNDKVIDLIDDLGDLLLHINIRENNRIILNSNISDKWGNEIQIDGELVGKIELKILVKSDYYKLLMDDKIIRFFTRRKNTNIRYFSINEDIKNFIFKVM